MRYSKKSSETSITMEHSMIEGQLKRERWFSNYWTLGKCFYYSLVPILGAVTVLNIDQQKPTEKIISAGITTIIAFAAGYCSARAKKECQQRISALEQMLNDSQK